jgi:hypothetical protein
MLAFALALIATSRRWPSRVRSAPESPVGDPMGSSRALPPEKLPQDQQRGRFSPLPRKGRFGVHARLSVDRSGGWAVVT